MIWRHGDVIIVAVAAVPAGARPQEGSVLVHGELTGHSHHLRDRTGAQLFRQGSGIFLSVDTAAATIVHEEHAPITLPHGVYKIWQQREYTPTAIGAWQTELAR